VAHTADDPTIVGHIEPIEATEDEFAAALWALTPAERARFLALSRERDRIKARKAKAPLTLRQFVDRISGGRVKWYTYAVVLCNVLQRVVDGVLTRVMIFAPPRHGKSELVSRYLPAYYLYRYPDRWVGLASYGHELAHTLAKSARANFFLYREEPERGAVKQWETGRGGGMWSTGIMGGFLGKGFHLGIVDDPIANAEQASSETIRRGHKDWWQSTWQTRAEPNAALVIIQQRWNEDDLSGYLLEEEWRESTLADDAAPERWHIVNFEALRSSPAEMAADEELNGRPLFPPTCTVEPDWRKTGEALCEERYPRERLLRTMRRIGAYFWNALYQQRPRARAGLTFQIDKLRIVEAHDIEWSRLIIVRYWDKAATESETADFTVGGLLGYDPVVDMSYVLDLVRGQWEPGERDLIIERTTRKDVDRFGTVRYTAWGEQEPASAGKDSARAFRSLVKAAADGVRCFTERATGSKTDRADPLASDCNNDQVRMLRASWNSTLRREFVDFPNGMNDDIVDACAGAYNKAARRRTPPTEIAPTVSRRTA
jgi:predicted phage terminase large subunit-like protein